MKRIGPALAAAFSITLMAAAIGLTAGCSPQARWPDDYSRPPSTGTWQIGRASCRERV